jgi:flagellar assembly protein FliH
MSAIATKSKFLFDIDFGSGASSSEKPITPAEHAAKIGEAENKGFRDGMAAAEKERLAEAEQRTAVAFERIAAALEHVARGLNAVEARLASETIDVAVAVGRKLAPELIAREPFAEIEALASDCFKQLVAAPHVVVRVNDALHAMARERLEDMASTSGFEGRLVVMAEPDVAVGDCKIEWADGGLARDKAAIDAAITEAVTRYVSARRSKLPELGEITR